MTGTDGGERLSVGEVLERDHHRIDGYLDKFAASLQSDGPIDVEAFRTGSAGLRHHIYVEEMLQFPAIRGGGLMGAILVMLREHGELWDRMDAIEAQLAAGADRTMIADTWELLRAGLDSHNEKEEEIVYPAGDKLLKDDLSDEIRETLASPDVPAGWTCEMAGRS